MQPRSAIDAQQQELAKRWQDAAKASPPQQVEPLAWSDAVARVLARNPEIQHAIADRQTAERSLRQVYNRLVPLVSVQVGVTETLHDLLHQGIRNFLTQVDMFSYFDGVMSMNRDHYAAELSYLRAMAAEELVRRETIAELYRAFIADRELQRAEQLVERARGWLSFLSSSAATGQNAANWEDLRMQVRSRREEWQTSVAGLLQSFDEKILLKSDTVPRFDYAGSPILDRDPGQVGVIQRQLVAIELVGAEARLAGAKLAYWPDLSAYVSSGPLFTNTNGQSYWFSTDQLTLSAGIRVPVDLNGQLKNGVTEARQALEVLRTEVSAKQRLLLREYHQKQRELGVIEHDLERLEKKTRLVEQLMVSGPPTMLASRLQAWIQLQSSASDLRLKRADVTSLFLTLDETFWSTMDPKAAGPTRVLAPTPGHPGASQSAPPP
jgi:hypothetical protein